MPAYAKMSTDSPEIIADVITYGRIVCVFSMGVFFESIWTEDPTGKRRHENTHDRADSRCGGQYYFRSAAYLRSAWISAPWNCGFGYSNCCRTDNGGACCHEGECADLLQENSTAAGSSRFSGSEYRISLCSQPTLSTFSDST